MAWPALWDERVGGGETMDMIEKKQSQLKTSNIMAGTVGV